MGEVRCSRDSNLKRGRLPAKEELDLIDCGLPLGMPKRHYKCKVELRQLCNDDGG